MFYSVHLNNSKAVNACFLFICFKATVFKQFNQELKTFSKKKGCAELIKQRSGSQDTLALFSANIQFRFRDGGHKQSSTGAKWLLWTIQCWSWECDSDTEEQEHQKWIAHFGHVPGWNWWGDWRRSNNDQLLPDSHSHILGQFLSSVCCLYLWCLQFTFADSHCHSSDLRWMAA